MDLTPITRGRYANGARRALSEFLKHYLALDHASLTAKWRGVDLLFEFPELAPEEKLKRPRIVIEEPRDEVQRTFVSSGQTQHYGEWHNLSFELYVLTDAHTGGTITSTDLAGAIELSLADHAGDLEELGLNLLNKVSEPGTHNPDTGLFEKVVRVDFDLQVRGQAFRTLEVELARFTFNATGQGTFVDNLTLERAQKLRLLLLKGTGTNASAVTVTATNEAGLARRLTGFIPPTRSGGTYVAVVDEDPEDKYTDVTGIAVSSGSGLPGETFTVVNIPEELGG